MKYQTLRPDFFSMGRWWGGWCAGKEWDGWWGEGEVGMVVFVD